MYILKIFLISPGFSLKYAKHLKIIRQDNLLIIKASKLPPEVSKCGFPHAKQVKAYYKNLRNYQRAALQVELVL